VADQKKYLRTILKEARNALVPETAAEISARVQSLLISSAAYGWVRTVVLYASKDNEVATDIILEHALASGRAVFYPRFQRSASVLELARVRDRSELVPGTFGVLEPFAEAEPFDPRHFPKLLIVVPGVAFSLAGERLGRGGGHYDRLLSELGPHAITVGLAYSFQALDHLPQSRWDRRLNYLVTESAVHPAPGMPALGGGLSEGGAPR
jgi:5-formyltetrahydrofolate cyclo-ligase